MRKLLLLSFLLISIQVYSQNTQEGYINDSDGYTNVRNDQSSTADIISIIKEGEIFNYEISKESNWSPVSKRGGTKGFIHNSRIVDVLSQAAEIQKFFFEIKGADQNNVEFWEVANEELYNYAEKYPKSFVIAYQKSDPEIARLVINELESPIHDLIPLDLVYQRLKHISLDSADELLDAVKVAGEKSGVVINEK